MKYVRRISDGKVLPVVTEQCDEICVSEMFDFADGGPSPRPLKLWHPKTDYEPAHVPDCAANGGTPSKDAKNLTGRTCLKCGNGIRRVDNKATTELCGFCTNAAFTDKELASLRQNQDTPRTNRHQYIIDTHNKEEDYCRLCTDADFARQLERDLAAANAENDKLRAELATTRQEADNNSAAIIMLHDQLATMMTERDAANAELATTKVTLGEIAEQRNIAQHDIITANAELEKTRVRLETLESVNALNGTSIEQGRKANQELQDKLDRAVRCVKAQVKCLDQYDLCNTEHTCENCTWWVPGINCNLADEARAIVEGK